MPNHWMVTEQQPGSVFLPMGAVVRVYRCVHLEMRGFKLQESLRWSRVSLLIKRMGTICL